MSRSSTLLGLLLVLAAGSVGCTEASAETPSHTQAMRRPPPPDERVVPSLGLRAELVDGSGRALPAFLHGGRRFVMGELGERYRIRVVNPTSSRVEAVVSVDGLDVLDGRPATTTKRGYIIPAFGETTIEGFRTSMDEVAAFRFSSVRDAYASRKGDDRNVGVIGVAFFAEKEPPPQVLVPEPYPYPPYPVPYDGRDEEYDDYRPGPSESVTKRAPAPRPASPPRATADKSADAPSASPPHGGGGASMDRDDSVESRQRPGLGTEFGETRWSRVSYTSFERATAAPFTVVELRYNNASGLAALGIPVRPVAPADDLYLRETANPFPGADGFAAPPPAYR